MVAWLSPMSRLVALFSLVFFLPACTVSERVSLEDTEGVIPESIFEAIKFKKTQKKWVVDNLGQPFSIQNRTEKQQVYNYRFARRKIRNGQMLFLFRYGRSEDDVSFYHVAFEDNVVRNAWMDEFATVQLYDGAIEGLSDYPKPDKPKSSGFRWKLPFFKNKTEKEKPISNSGDMNMMKPSSEKGSSKSPMMSEPPLEQPVIDLPSGGGQKENMETHDEMDHQEEDMMDKSTKNSEQKKKEKSVIPSIFERKTLL